jgi:hypothetical protein
MSHPIDVCVYTTKSPSLFGISIEVEGYILTTDTYRHDGAVQHSRWRLWPTYFDSSDPDEDIEEDWEKEVRGSFQHALAVLCTHFYYRMPEADLGRIPKCSRDDRYIPAEWCLYTHRPESNTLCVPTPEDEKHPTSCSLNELWEDWKWEVQAAMDRCYNRSLQRC